MGRRKIEIKAIKDDRNRSVTFLKRKGGLFKKAHELSVLCSVDVAVFIFGNNKKLYEYSSADMRDLITRYQYHGGPSEHKGPSDFNGGNDDDDDEENEGTPPRGHDGMDGQMMPPQFHGQPQPPFPQIQHHTPSASPPIGTNGGHFQAHPGHHIQRGHTPQPPIGSRPGSRNDMRGRIGPGMVAQQGPPPGPSGPPHPNISYMPTPPIFNAPGMMPPQGPYPYTPQPQQHSQVHPPPPPPPQHQHSHQHPQHQQPYMDERRTPQPPAFTSQPPTQGLQAPVRHEPSPQPNHQQLPPNPPHISPPPPQPMSQPERRMQDPPPPPPIEPKTESQDRPQPPLLNTDTAIKKLPQRKSHSIFTPIEENRSILSQHLASFASEPIKSELGTSVTASGPASRSQSVDVGAMNRTGSGTSSPPMPQPPQRPGQTTEKSRTVSLSSIPETTLTPPSRSNSVKVGGGARPRGPRLTVQIPGGASESGDSPAGDSNSPRTNTEPTTQPPQRHNSQSSLVLPPPSPSASALLSAGATGPPNPFARPPPQTTVNGESTPVSALPSRFLNNELLPSPSSFYPEWNFRGDNSNTLPSPLNFATPVVGSGPSFLRDDNAASSLSSSINNSNLNVGSSTTAATKRKTPEYGLTSHNESAETESDSKRVRVE
ncbi:hypothetical protein BGZ63DRAFT_419321 [Mariannaea sp. PMI_226]|nr:hypothetical protein BGZ63DRAFT_419321 [Mariannaea sp. PMI_226]